MSESSASEPESHLEVIDLTINEGYDKRTKIVRELFTSEEIYVQNLSTMIEGYLEPMRKNQILPAKTLSGIFSNIEIIQKFHVHFLSSLSQRLSEWNCLRQLGDIFLSLAPYLKMYSQYCSNYDNAIGLVQQSKKSSPDFAKFLSDSQNDPKFKGSYISSYLILPIQRIPRYELFLKEIVKITGGEHPDALHLEKALELVANLAESVNESCLKAENILKIIEISKSINMEKLLKPARKYIREDEVEVISETYSGQSRCYLFNDLIVITTKKSRSKQYLSANLILCWIKDGREREEVEVISTNISILLKFSSQSAKEAWEVDFSKTLKLLEASGKDFGIRVMYNLVKEGEGYKVVKVFGGADIPSKKKKNRLINSLKKRKKLTSSSDKSPLYSLFNNNNNIDNNNNSNSNNNNNNDNNNDNNNRTSNYNINSKIDRILGSPKKGKDFSPRDGKSQRDDQNNHSKFMRRSHSISNNLKHRKDIDLFAPLPKLSESIVPIKKSKEI